MKSLRILIEEPEKTIKTLEIKKIIARQTFDFAGRMKSYFQCNRKINDLIGDKKVFGKNLK